MAPVTRSRPKSSGDVPNGLMLNVPVRTSLTLNQDGLESAKPDLQSMFKKPGDDLADHRVRVAVRDASAERRLRRRQGGCRRVATEVRCRVEGDDLRFGESCCRPGEDWKRAGFRRCAHTANGPWPAEDFQNHVGNRFTSTIGLTRVENGRSRRRRESHYGHQAATNGAAGRGSSLLGDGEFGRAERDCHRLGARVGFGERDLDRVSCLVPSPIGSRPPFMTSCAAESPLVRPSTAIVPTEARDHFTTPEGPERRPPVLPSRANQHQSS